MRPRLPEVNILAEFNQKAMHVEVDTSITSERLIRIFKRLHMVRGMPQILCTEIQSDRLEHLPLATDGDNAIVTWQPPFIL